MQIFRRRGRNDPAAYVKCELLDEGDKDEILDIVNVEVRSSVPSFSLSRRCYSSEHAIACRSYEIRLCVPDHWNATVCFQIIGNLETMHD